MAHILQTRFVHLVGIGDVDGRHVEASPVEAGPLAELLNDLHHDPLAVGLVASLISLGQVEAHPVGVFQAQALHDVQGPLAQRLRNDTIILITNAWGWDSNQP